MKKRESPYKRDFISVENANAKRCVRFMSYNILANGHVKRFLYPHHKITDITGSARPAMLAAEIAHYCPDVLCVQELEAGQLDAFAAMPALRGFHHCFAVKRHAPGLVTAPEGVAVFARAEAFTLVRKLTANFDLRLHDNYDQNDALLAEMTKACSAAILLLEGENGKRFAVVSIHLPFNMKQGHVKLGVLCLLCKALALLRALYDLSDFFVCGDFNTIPNSMLYRFLSEGRIDFGVSLREYSNQLFQENLLKRMSVQKALLTGDRRFSGDSSTAAPTISASFVESLLAAKPEIGDGDRIVFRADAVKRPADLATAVESVAAPMKFASAYASVLRSSAAEEKEQNKEAFVTFCGESFKGCVDYIFYSREGNARPLRVLAAPSLDDLEALPRTLPSSPYASDHISLVADFDMFGA